MALNKAKCGTIKVSSRGKKLTQQEIKEDNVLGIKFVDSYKYLGIQLDKRLQPSYHLEVLSKKLEKFKKMTNILRFQRLSSKTLKFVFTIFAQATLNYGNFIFHEDFCSQDANKKYLRLYSKTIKHTFNFFKATNLSEMYTSLLIVPPEQ